MKYSTPIVRESAHEILQQKLIAEPPPQPQSQPRRAARREKSVFDSPMAKTVGRQVARTVTQQVIRGIFGILRGR